MATYYGVKGSSDWNAGNWSTTATKDATRTGSGVTPTASDDCILDDWTSDGGGVTWTINATTCVCKTLTCTGYAGALAFGANRLSASGNVVFAAGMTLTSTGTSGILRFMAAGSLTMAGLTFPGSVTYAVGGTFPLAETTNITGTLTLNASVVYSGAVDISCGTLTIDATGITVQFVSGQTVTVATAINAATNGFVTATIRSTTATSEAFLHFNGDPAACKIAGITFTDINCAHAIDNWYGGTLTRCTGITNRTSADFATAAQAGSIISGTTISGVAGTYHEATEAEVQSGVTFGASSALTGTYVGSGGAAVGPFESGPFR